MRHNYKRILCRIIGHRYYFEGVQTFLDKNEIPRALFRCAFCGCNAWAKMKYGEMLR